MVGDLKIVDGTQGAGKVLTSDANGLASWEPSVEQVGFMSCISSTQSLTGFQNNVVEFDTEVFDDGTNFDPTTYSFTAPTAGLYHFDIQVSVYSSTGAYPFYGILRINGTPLHGTYQTIQLNERGTADLSVNLKLSSSDVIDYVLFPWNQESGTTLPNAGAQSCFSGYKVY